MISWEAKCKHPSKKTDFFGSRERKWDHLVPGLWSAPRPFGQIAHARDVDATSAVAKPAVL